MLLASVGSDASEAQPSLLPFPLPQQVDGWVAAGDEELGEDVLRQIEPDAYAMRAYEADGRTRVWVYVGMYGGRGGYGRELYRIVPTAGKGEESQAQALSAEKRREIARKVARARLTKNRMICLSIL